MGYWKSIQGRRASLANIDVRGKIVFDETGKIGRIETGVAIMNAGGVAMILMNEELKC